MFKRKCFVNIGLVRVVLFIQEVKQKFHSYFPYLAAFNDIQQGRFLRHVINRVKVQ